MKKNFHERAVKGCLCGAAARMLSEADSGRRFAPRVIEDKRYKKPKHKLRVFE